MLTRPSIYTPKRTIASDMTTAVLDWLDGCEIRTLRIGAVGFCAVVWAAVAVMMWRLMG